MGDQAGSTLQNYNSDLVHCIEELREKREDLNKSIAQDEEEEASSFYTAVPEWTCCPTCRPALTTPA